MKHPPLARTSVLGFLAAAFLAVFLAPALRAGDIINNWSTATSAYYLTFTHAPDHWFEQSFTLPDARYITTVALKVQRVSGISTSGSVAINLQNATRTTTIGDVFLYNSPQLLAPYTEGGVTYRNVKDSTLSLTVNRTLAAGTYRLRVRVASNDGPTRSLTLLRRTTQPTTLLPVANTYNPAAGTTQNIPNFYNGVRVTASGSEVRLTPNQFTKGQTYSGFKLEDQWTGTTLRNQELNFSSSSRFY
jgi:hypothetical protein